MIDLLPGIGAAPRTHLDDRRVKRDICIGSAKNALGETDGRRRRIHGSSRFVSLLSVLTVAVLVMVQPVRPLSLISPTFSLRYPLAMSSGPIRVTEPLLDVLEALLQARDYELYGWAITKATHRASPTVYKILERLTDYGMVTARWEDRHPDVNKPRRRFYRLTGHGATVATTMLQERRPSRTAPRPSPTAGWAGTW
jgi:PadR family transcriptional regulator, regulatory protein PadR